MKSETIFDRKIFSKGHNSVKDVDGVTVLFLCASSDGDIFVQSFMKLFLMVLKL